ncbi:MAG: alpha-glucuronidase, partial [Oscillospiraceae bacterium]|nr:alpha-glucuronidase [Oscillospiraceae bacterium]
MIDSCWLNYDLADKKYAKYLRNIDYDNRDDLIQSAIEELNLALLKMGFSHNILENENEESGICLIKDDDLENDEAFSIQLRDEKIYIYAKSSKGFLYGVFKLLAGMQLDDIEEKRYTPMNDIRMIDHWDTLNGKVERGYAGGSIFFCNDDLNKDTNRIKDYARFLCSIGINSICINNINVDYEATRLIFDKLYIVKDLNEIFRKYGIKLFISANFAAPITMGELSTADPLDKDVKNWWMNKCKEIYHEIPDLGGFVMKADSEGRIGPFTYGRNHADGANMFAKALKPYGGSIIWRCFVYNCHQDWRDRTTDRAKAAYDNFLPLDGLFDENVYLQVKNGPMDFQVREPVNPLFSAMKKTKVIMEFQITQEYTGQQIHICYLAPLWKEVLDFDTDG